VYLPETAEEANSSLSPIIRRIGDLARRRSADLNAVNVFRSWLNGASVGELSAEALTRFPSVKIVDGIHEDLNGDLTLAFLAAGLVAVARLDGEDIPLPSLTGEPVEGLTAEQVEIFNLISKTLNRWALGYSPWLSDFLVCVSLLRYFEPRAQDLPSRFRKNFRKLRKDTLEAMRAYQNGFLLWAKSNRDSLGEDLPEDFARALEEVEFNLSDTDLGSASAGAVAVNYASAATLGIVRKIMMTFGTSGIAAAGASLPVTSAALLLSATYLATKYGSAIEEQFASLARDWKLLAKAYDLRATAPQESEAVLASLEGNLSERCRVGSKVECYVKYGITAGLAAFAYYKWLRFSQDQLTSS
jgi:hypothetical protein